MTFATVTIKIHTKRYKCICTLNYKILKQHDLSFMRPHLFLFTFIRNSQIIILYTYSIGFIFSNNFFFFVIVLILWISSYIYKYEINYFVDAVVSNSTITNIDGITCFVCSPAKHLSDCTDVQKCQPGEVRSVVKKIDIQMVKYANVFDLKRKHVVQYHVFDYDLYTIQVAIGFRSNHLSCFFVILGPCLAYYAVSILRSYGDILLLNFTSCGILWRILIFVDHHTLFCYNFKCLIHILVGRFFWLY